MIATLPNRLQHAGIAVEHDAQRGLLRITTGGRSLELACQGLVDQAAGPDAGDAWSGPEADGPDAWVFTARSSRWQRRELLVAVDAGGVSLRLRVHGRGAVAAVVFAAGLPEGFPARPGSTIAHLTWARRERTRCWSASPISHRTVFNPQPDGYGEQELPPACDQRNTCATTFGPERFNTFFAPAIPAYVLDRSWCLGIAAGPGQDGFTHLDYAVGDGWGLVLHFDGHTAVDGSWTSPALRITPCREVEDGLRRFVGHLRATGCAPAGLPPPAWIRRPMLCTWGQQTAWAQQAEQGVALPLGSPATPGANGFASEDGCREVVRLAEAAGLPFGTLTIDAGWSDAPALPVPDPRLWRDLKGFIAAQHARGRKVLLWLGAWHAGGLDPGLCMPHDPGLRDVADPTNPAFRSRLAAAVAHCMSPAGLDADGFKLDYTGDMPRGPGYRPARPGLWGQALLRDYLSVIRSAMAVVKPDSVLQTHCASPYFADLSQCLRLNDIFAQQRDIRTAMTFRARMAAIANPEAAIDCDCDPFSDRGAWLDWLRHQPALGTPSLYTLTHLGFPGPDGTLAAIEPADLAEVAGIWRAYLARLAGEPAAQAAG